MTDVLTPLGSLSIGACIPGAVAAINLALPDLQAQVTALLAFAPAAINFQADLVLATQITASISAGIAAGISPPSFAAQIAIVASILGVLQARLSAILAITGLFAQAGVFAYAYDGRADGLGPTLAAELAGGFPGGTGAAEHTNALVLATTTGATWTAMQTVFKTS